MICLPAYTFADWDALSCVVVSNDRGDTWAIHYGSVIEEADGYRYCLSYMLDIDGDLADWSFAGIVPRCGHPLDQSSICQSRHTIER